MPVEVELAAVAESVSDGWYRMLVNAGSEVYESVPVATIVTGAFEVLLVAVVICEAAEVLTGTVVVGACVDEASEVAPVVEIVVLSALESVIADALVPMLMVEEAGVLSVLASVLTDALADSLVARIAVAEALAEGLKLNGVDDTAVETRTLEEEVNPKLVDPERGTDVEMSVPEDAVLLPSAEDEVGEALTSEEVVTATAVPEDSEDEADALKEVLPVTETDEEVALLSIPVADATSDVLLSLAVWLAFAEDVREPDVEPVAEADAEVKDPETLAELVVKDAEFVAEANPVANDGV